MVLHVCLPWVDARRGYPCSMPVPYCALGCVHVRLPIHAWMSSLQLVPACILKLMPEFRQVCMFAPVQCDCRVCIKVLHWELVILCELNCVVCVTQPDSNDLDTRRLQSRQHTHLQWTHRRTHTHTQTRERQRCMLRPVSLAVRNFRRTSFWPNSHDVRSPKCERKARTTLVPGAGCGGHTHETLRL